MKCLLLLLLVSVALAAPQGEEKPPATSPKPQGDEKESPETPREATEAPGEEEATEASPTGGSVKSNIGSQSSLEKLVDGFEELEQSGVLPVAVPSVATDENYGAKVNIFGVDVPVILLAKVGLAIVAAASKAIGGGGTAAAASALGAGVSFPEASDPAAVARILKETTSTAAAIFDGDVAGEVYFAQSKLAEGTADAAATVITAKFSGVPAGAYSLEVRESGDVADACANVGPRFSADKSEARLGSLSVDEGGQASAILSRRGINLAGTSSILGRSVVLVASDADPATSPVACAVIVRQ